MNLLDELALWNEYDTDYFAVSLPSEVGYLVIKQQLYVFLNLFFTIMSCSYFHNRLHGTCILMMSWLSLCIGRKLGKQKWCPGRSMLVSSLVRWILATEKEHDLGPIFAALKW